MPPAGFGCEGNKGVDELGFGCEVNRHVDELGCVVNRFVGGFGEELANIEGGF